MLISRVHEIFWTTRLQLFLYLTISRPGVPQGSSLGPLLYYMHISNFSKESTYMVTTEQSTVVSACNCFIVCELN
jgi:hypothetical protein